MAENHEQQMLSSTELAGLLGLSVMSIGRLTNDGILVPQKGQRPRRYPMDDSIHRYIKYLRDKIESHGDVKDALNESRLAESELRRRKLEMQVMVAEGGALRAEDVEAVMNDMVGSFRTRLRTLPQELAAKLGHAPSRKKILDVTKAEIYNVCRVLSVYRPEDFYARNPDYVGLANTGPEQERG